MKKGMILFIIFLMTCFTMFSSSSDRVLAGLKPILPFEGSILGVDYYYSFSNFTSYIGTAYDYSNNEVYYHLGNKFTYNDMTFNLGYGYWLNSNLVSYLYQRGFEGSLYYARDLDQSLQISLFDGIVGNMKKDIETDYIYLGYNKLLYFDWDKEVKFCLGITSGMVKETGDNYYTLNLKVPLKFNKFNSFKIVPRLGYIKQTDLLNPYYDLASYVRGYDWGVKTGNRFAAITLEQQVQLFPYSDYPFLGLLNGAIFANAGDVLAVGEGIEEFELHSSAGAGLIMAMGQSEFRLERVITDQGNWKTFLFINYNL